VTTKENGLYYNHLGYSSTIAGMIAGIQAVGPYQDKGIQIQEIVIILTELKTVAKKYCPIPKMGISVQYLTYY
jgi:hypothetical protein